ncbi:WhiB family transcriptional regulator [Mycobacterium sp. MUNTM1]
MSGVGGAARPTNLALVENTPGATVENDRAWVSKALCRGTDPDALFVRGAKQREATVICRRCPVMRECGAEALDNRVEFGVWGGMTERQRRALLKQNPQVASWTEFFDKRNAASAGQRPGAPLKVRG